MKTLLLITMIAVVRPPVPTDMPFIYDVNQCPVEPMDWAVVEPNMSIIYQGTVTNRGLMVDVRAVNLTEPNDYMLVEFDSAEKAPGGFYKRHFSFNFVPQPIERVNYIQITATDRAGRTDSRMLLVYAIRDEPPILSPYDKEPVAAGQLDAAERYFQKAKKKHSSMVGYIGRPVVWGRLTARK